MLQKSDQTKSRGIRFISQADSIIDSSQDQKLAPYMTEKLQFTKLGNSKILVVKKKQSNQRETPTNNSHLMQTAPLVSSLQQQQPVNQFYQSHSQQRSVIDDYQNSMLGQNLLVDKTQSTQNSRTITPMKQLQTSTLKYGQSTATTAFQETPFKEDASTHQMININQKAYVPVQPMTTKNAKGAAILNNNNTATNPQRQVGFNFGLTSSFNQTMGSESSSLERIEESRKLNSKRQFKISNSKSGSKKKGNKSPSDFTNCGKSVVSLFSTQSGKTNHSAPLRDSEQNLGESPKYQSKFKIQHLKKQDEHKRPKAKKKLRPSSSISPSNSVSMTAVKANAFNRTGTNFNIQEQDCESQSIDIKNSHSSKKVIPLKKIQFPKGEAKSQSMLPKPPLHKKNQNEVHTTEALLKMADEGLASIEMELKQSKKGFKFLRSQANSLDKVKQVTLKQPKKNEIQTNFNLSFNNSFNTSYNNNSSTTAIEPQVLAFSTTPTQDAVNECSTESKGQPPQYQGFFTADAIYLEKQLTNRLKEASDNEGKKMQAFTQTFNEIIKRDKNFGSLLLKIKQAYDEYIRRSVTPTKQSPVEKPTYEELQHRVESVEIELKASRQRTDEQQKYINQMRGEIEDKKKAMENLIQENDRLSGNYESFKISNLHVNKSVSISETLKSLQLSNSSNRTGTHNLGIVQNGNSKIQVGSSQSSQASRQQLIKDLNFLVSQNLELTNACQQLDNEVTYFKLREKKIMYLVFILQNRGYPVNQVFDSEVKNIPTMRFQEFLDNNPELEDQLHVDNNDEEAKNNLFSFRTDDSFDLITTGPAMIKRRPTIVPALNLYGLPEYESSSDEGDAEPNKQATVQANNTNPQYYQESLKYIENFYNKYASEMHKGNTSKQDDSVGIEIGQDHQSSVQQISYYDSLSRDEEGQDDINEEIMNA